MINKFIPKLFATTIVVIVLIFLIYGLYSGHKFNNDIFRLSSNQIAGFLVNTKTQCKNIADCELLAGDVLIRRHITSRTWVMDKLAHLYFTHSAFYLGSDQLVEAVGTEKDPQDDIQIDNFSKSDWLNYDMVSFVIIRPKNYLSKLEAIKINLKNIAEDPDYIFGLPKQGHKRTTCADLIFKQLADEGIVAIYSEPPIITPDYLFWLAVNNPDDFEIIGYDI